LPLHPTYGKIIVDGNCRTPEISLRLEQAETSRLTWAFTFSLILHLLIGGTYYVGHEYGWWKNLHWPAWMKSAKMLTELLQKPQPQLEERQIEVPLVFVEVTPAQAATEAPKETKFILTRIRLRQIPNQRPIQMSQKSRASKRIWLRRKTFHGKRHFPLTYAPTRGEIQRRATGNKTQTDIHGG